MTRDQSRSVPSLVNGVTNGREEKKGKERTYEKGESCDFKGFGRKFFRVYCLGGH